MTDRELGQITAPAMFCLATGDPFPQPGTGPPRHRPDPRSSAPEVPGGHGPLAGRSCWLRQARDQPPHRDRIRACRLGQAACGALRYGRWAIRIFIARATWPGGICNLKSQGAFARMPYWLSLFAACQHGAAGRAPLRRSPTPRSPTGMPTMTCGGSLSNAGRPRRAGRHLAAALLSSGRSSSRRHRTTVALPA